MNSNLLKAKMVANGDTQADLAKAIGISAATLNYKINGKVSFRASDITAIRQRYNLSADDVDLIFFGNELS